MSREHGHDPFHDERAQRRLVRAVQLLAGCADVSVHLESKGARGYRGLCEQSPVAVWLSTLLGRVCGVVDIDGPCAYALCRPGQVPDRVVCASFDLPAEVGWFMDEFDAGVHPRLDLGAPPAVEHPWGELYSVHTLGGGAHWVRAEGDEGIVAHRAGPRCREMTAECRAAALPVGMHLCWGLDAWAIAANEMRECLPVVMGHAPAPFIEDQHLRVLEYALNRTQEGRGYMRRRDMGWLWEDDAVTEYSPQVGGLVNVYLAGGGRATVTHSSVEVFVRRKVYPIRLADLEVMVQDG